MCLSKSNAEKREHKNSIRSSFCVAKSTEGVKKPTASLWGKTLPGSFLPSRLAALSQYSICGLTILQREILLPPAPTWSVCSKGQICPFTYFYVFIYSSNADAVLSCQNLSTLVFSRTISLPGRHLFLVGR